MELGGAEFEDFAEAVLCENGFSEAELGGAELGETEFAARSPARLSWAGWGGGAGLCVVPGKPGVPSAPSVGVLGRKPVVPGAPSVGVLGRKPVVGLLG
jgi:hypothetical protein